MALDHLLAALERDAIAAAERVRADGRAEAERLTATSTATADQRRDAEVSELRRQRRERMEEELGMARRAGRAQVLEARERVLARIDAALRSALPRVIARPEYLAEFPSLVAGGLACLAEGEAVRVRTLTTLVPAVRAAWPAGRACTVTPDEGIGTGFRLTSEDGAVEIEETLEARYAARRTGVLREALRRLGVTT